MVEESEDNRLDQSLRDTFDDYELTPSAPVWKGIEQRLAQLPPPVLPRRRRRLVPLPLLFGLVALLAGLGGWLLPHGGPAAVSTAPLASTTKIFRPGGLPVGASEGPTGTSAGSVGGSEGPTEPAEAPVGGSARPVGASEAPTRRSKVAVGASVPAIAWVKQALSVANGRPEAQPVTGGAEGPASAAKAGTATTPVVFAAAVAATPAVLRPLLALETEYAAQAKPSLTDPATASRAAVVATLRAERAELFHLQRRTDSLLLALGDMPAATPLAALPDTAQARPELPKDDLLGRRWSLLLTAAPEQNAVTLQGRPDDKLSALRQGHETGRAGFSAALAAEYKATPRLSVGGGLGYAQFGTEFRLTNRRTEVDVTYDTTTHTALTIGSSVHHGYSIRLVDVPHLTPVFNGSGQLIDYDTVYTQRPDTTFTTTVLTDTLRTVTRTVTPLLNKREVTSTQTFKPQYRFLTLPLQLRYRITPPGTSRWWTDVALGAQLQFFLGGTQAVTSDGENYRTEKITAGSGPFRPVNLALSGSLALNYGLTNRLSVSVAPSLRWQALSVYKSETGLRQQSTATGVMLGVRWAL